MVAAYNPHAIMSNTLKAIDGELQRFVAKAKDFRTVFAPAAPHKGAIEFFS